MCVFLANAIGNSAPLLTILHVKFGVFIFIKLSISINVLVSVEQTESAIESTGAKSISQFVQVYVFIQNGNKSDNDSKLKCKQAISKAKI